MTTGPSVDADQPCRACGAHRPTPEFEAISWRDGSSHRLFECPSCGTLNLVGFVDPAPYYDATYTSFAPRSIPRDRAILRVGGRALMALTAHRTGLQALRPVATALPDWARWFGGFGVGPETHVVDVGSGTGALLLQLRRFGFRALTGLDPYLPAPISYPGVRILRTELDAFVESADVIVFNHSLEHVDDPLRLLEVAATRLTDRGPIVVRLPLSGSALWLRYRDNWRALDPPVHRFVPTVAGVRRLAARAGLTVERVETYTPTGAYVASELLRRGLDAGGGADLSAAERRYLARLARREHRWEGAMGSFVLALDRSRDGSETQPVSRRPTGGAP